MILSLLSPSNPCCTSFSANFHNASLVVTPNSKSYLLLLVIGAPCSAFFGSGLKQNKFLSFLTVLGKKNGEKRTYGSYNVQPPSTRKSSLYRYNHLRALVIAIRNFMPHRNNEYRCNAAELMYEKCKNWMDFGLYLFVKFNEESW